MKKVILIVSLCFVAFLFSSNTSETQHLPPPPNGLICVDILGITGCYPENWEDDWEVCIVVEYEQNGVEYCLELCTPAVLNQTHYCWTAMDGLYVTIRGKLKENGETITLKNTQTIGYVDDSEPLVCYVSWACE